MNCMKVIVKLILSILLILPCSCTKELTDEEDVYKVTNHGKSLFIYLSSGDLLESQTKDLDISKIEELEIQGHVGGFKRLVWWNGFITLRRKKNVSIKSRKSFF